MNSELGSIFSISVVGGVIGLAFADSISANSISGTGFGLGMLGTFAFFTGVAAITNKSRSIEEFQKNNSVTEKLETSSERSIRLDHRVAGKTGQDRNIKTSM